MKEIVIPEFEGQKLENVWVRWSFYAGRYRGTIKQLNKFAKDHNVYDNLEHLAVYVQGTVMVGDWTVKVAFGLGGHLKAMVEGTA